MKNFSDSLIEGIHASGFKAALVVTGGGSEAVHALLSRSGASRFVLEAQIPYSPEALSDYLGEAPAQSCSEETARCLAVRALEKASHLTPSSSLPVGIACTAALHTNRERKGSDRAFICIRSAEKEIRHMLDLSPGSRMEQEGVVSEMLLGLIAGFVGVER